MRFRLFISGSVARLMTIAVVAGLLITGCNMRSGADSADMVLMDAVVATVDSDFSIAEAVAIKDGVITFVGSNSDVEAYIGGGTEVLRLDGAMVLPGLVDAHGHLHSLGDQLASLDVNNTTSYEEIVELVAGRVEETPAGEWIVGGRWNQNVWPVREFPHHAALSAVSPDNPVFLMRVDGNSAFANSKAMELAGITRDTPDPSGGRIIRDADGEPTGVLINQAMNAIRDILPEPAPEEMEERLKMAVEACLEVGMTGVHEAGIGEHHIELYKRLIDRGELDMRIYAMYGEQERPVMEGDLYELFSGVRVPEYGNHMLSVNSIKVYFDGALGSRGAAFFEPYDDDPGNIGVLRVTPEYITKVTEAALRAGMGVATHCIGIRGTRLAIDAYEEALGTVPTDDHRLRIEHAQIVRYEDVEKFRDLDIIPSMQPIHATSDMSYVVDRIGEERAEGGYAWRWFIDAGLPLPMGSDFPVEPVNPLYGIYAAITRQDHDGNPPGGWFPEQRVTIQEAIKGFTIWAAHAAYQDEVLGSLEKGKLADITVLDRNILEVEPKELLQTEVLYTIVGGEIKYIGR